MADHATLDYVRQLLDEMTNNQLRPDGQGPSREDLQKRVQSLRDQLAADEEEAKGKATTDEAWKKFDKNVENLAKALPGVVKGVISADNAFKKGDAFGGSAAIMDICASLAPLLGGLSAAGGPPGMLVGAIFAMVGQILSLFAPQSEPLTSQIEALLRKLEAEKTQQHILTVHQQIKGYASSLRHAATSASQRLDDPVLNILVTIDLVQAINLLEGNTVTSFMNVMNWLNEPNNQTLDAWPTILSAACQAWADMMAAALTLLSIRVYLSQRPGHHRPAALDS